MNRKNSHPVSSYLVVVALLFLFTSCEQDSECVFIPDVAEVAVSLKFESLEDSILSLNSKDKVVTFFTYHPVLRDYLFGRRNYPDDSVFINTLYQRFNHPGFDTLYDEVKKVFGDVSELREEFTRAFSNLKYYYPDFVPPKIQTAITGLETDMIVTDTLIIVSLDYYLGSEGRYRPKLYDYLLTRYEPEDIVPSTLLIYGISERFNKTNLDDKTVLADMIAYGKSFYFAKHMLPCKPDSIFIWYSNEDIQGAMTNQDLVWARFVEDEVLYSTSHITKQKFLGERPKTLEVGEKCPGRIAQWVGWQIVKKYMETHPEKTLNDLMEMSDAQQLFKESRYKPERR